VLEGIIRYPLESMEEPVREFIPVKEILTCAGVTGAHENVSLSRSLMVHVSHSVKIQESGLA
jgi:hypothetical protein